MPVRRYYPLPANCENIPNLRIGFVWKNLDDGLATDPSFAVDDIENKIMAYFEGYWFVYDMARGIDFRL